MNNFKDINGLWDTLSGLVTGTEAEVIGKFPTESFCIFQIIHTLRFCWKINVEHFYDYFSLKQYCLIKESYIIVMQNFHNFFFFGWNKHMYIINEYNAENSVIVSWDQKRILGNTVLFATWRGCPYWLSGERIMGSGELVPPGLRLPFSFCWFWGFIGVCGLQSFYSGQVLVLVWGGALWALWEGFNFCFSQDFY